MVAHPRRGGRRARGIPAPRRPWLDDLDDDGRPARAPGRRRRRDPARGRATSPSGRRRRPCSSNPTATVTCSSTARAASGKSTVLRTIAIAAGAAARPRGRRGLRARLRLGRAPIARGRCRTSARSSPGDDAERVQRLLRTLGDMLDDRGKRSQRGERRRASREYRELTGRRRAPHPPAHRRLRRSSSRSGRPPRRGCRSTTIFMRILGEGRPLGVHVVATADRSGAVPTAVSANVTRRIVLRLSDESAYAMLGAPKDVLNERSVPGRAIVDGFETQLAVSAAPRTSPSRPRRSEPSPRSSGPRRARGRARSARCPPSSPPPSSPTRSTVCR